MKKPMVFEGVTVTLLILLLFLLLVMVSSGGPEQLSGISGAQYTYVGNDNTLYVFSGNDIHAIGGNGDLKWMFHIPDGWSVCTNYMLKLSFPVDNYEYIDIGNEPIASSDNGVLFVYLKPAKSGSSINFMNGTVMAISPDGRELWELPMESHRVNYGARGIDDTAHEYSDVRLYAQNGRVYAFHDYSETILAANGSILWSVGNVTDPAAIDERGFVYAVRAMGIKGNDKSVYPFTFYAAYVPDYQAPSGIIDAYYPNGTLYWENHPGNPLVRQYTACNTLPLYYNGTLYAPTYNGVTAFYPNGTTKWTRTYDPDAFKFILPQQGYPYQPDVKGDLRLYDAMPFDQKGDVYLQCVSNVSLPAINGVDYSNMMYLITIGPDGKELSRQYLHYYTYQAARDGIGYSINASTGFKRLPQSIDHRQFKASRGITDLDTDAMAAYNVETGQQLWNYTFPANDPTVIVLDNNNAQNLLGSTAAEAVNPDDKAASGPDDGPIISGASVQVCPANGIVYANFQSINYESPVRPGRSRCAQAGGIYAFDEDGELLWYKATPACSIARVTQNGTILYRTPDGRIGVTNAGFAAGFTLTALLYLFLRFVCLGAVARAKASLHKNEKRNLVYDFIARNPGLTIHEIARGTGVNIGTARYHAFILGLNHKITSCRTDGKYVRYFTNSNSYSREEQLILSIMRRDAIGKMLRLLVERPCMPSAEIARELGIQESAVCRYMRELSKKGIITREPHGKGCMVDEMHREHIMTAIERMNAR